MEEFIVRTKKRSEKLKTTSFEAKIKNNKFQTISQVEKFQVRQKDIVLSPILFTWLALVPGLASQPLILSPVAFSEYFKDDFDS